MSEKENVKESSQLPKLPRHRTPPRPPRLDAKLSNENSNENKVVFRNSTTTSNPVFRHSRPPPPPPVILRPSSDSKSIDTSRLTYINDFSDSSDESSDEEENQ